ncbi:hypothetical protein AAE478_000126 [Parahypoxylon ruwenzoriense]
MVTDGLDTNSSVAGVQHVPTRYHPDNAMQEEQIDRVSVESMSSEFPLSLPVPMPSPTEAQPSQLVMPGNDDVDPRLENDPDAPEVTSVLSGEASPLSTEATLQAASTLAVGGNGSTANIDSRLPIRQSLGLYGCFIIFGGSVLTLIDVAFLIFLWAGEGPAGGQEATAFWRLIMLRDGATRAVTLSSLVLRSVIAAQATVCTSLVAALLVERRQVRVSQVAQMSITRSVNSGPQQLIQEIICSRSVSMIFSLEAILLMILGLGSLGIQFTSTILLPDFNSTILVQDSETIRHNVALSPITENNVSDIFSTSWPTLQGSNALFGELDSQNMAEPNERGVSHDGPRLRAFLPFEREKRTRIRSYKGAAFTLKTEVSCQRPSIDASVKAHPWSLNVPYASMAGNISYNQTFEDAGIDYPASCYGDNYITLCFPTGFNCTIPSQRDGISAGWATAMCRLEAIGMTRGEADIDYWQITDDLYLPASMIFLTFATNADISSYDANDTQGKLGAPTAYGEWNSYELYPGAFLNVSLCFALLNTTISEVEMGSDTTLTEPEFKWSQNFNTPSLDVLQDFMGADSVHKSAEERGILSIRNVQHPVSHTSAFAAEVNASAAWDDVSFSEWASWHGPSAAIWAWANNNESLVLCTACQMRGFTALKDGAALFQRVVNSSGRVAVAIDTYMARMVQNFYYLMLPLFDVPGDVEVVFSTEARVPRQWGGLIAVLVMVAVDLACVWALTLLYARNARYTRQGDFWHAVSQLVADPTQTALMRSDELKDGEVAETLKGKDTLVTIGRSAKTGRVEVLEAGK